ncbi:MAG: glycerophosphodiester phosphodiesterase [Pyrinomonadaceae bacterium]|nr:glycerophosphodiester phosphodiesterase [Pyrinomonadaceae bacterium]
MVLRRILKFAAVFAGLMFAAVLGGYVYLAMSDGKRAKPLSLKGRVHDRPLLFAHRGGAQEAPENTIPAFEKAIERGIDVLELDVHLTSDEELVVLHDKALDRTTNVQGPVSERSLYEIKSADAGYSYSYDNGTTYPYRGLGIKIPTLREVFERFPDELINIEVKTDNLRAAKPLCGLIREYERTDSVIVASVTGEILSEFRDECAGVATSASFDEILWFSFLFKIGLTKSFSADMQVLQIPEEMFSSGQISREFIAAARERNLEVHIWTKNRKDDIKRLFEFGVDGIMTDRPSIVTGFVR